MKTGPTFRFPALYRGDFITLLLLVCAGGFCGVLYNWSLLSGSLFSDTTPDALEAPTIPPGIKQVQLAEVKAIYDAKSAVFLDARRSFFYHQKRIPGAETLPFTQMEQFWGAFEKKIGKEVPLILYCSGYDCEDSQLLANKLQDYGYQRLAVFHGGFPEWEQAGYPTIASSTAGKLP